MNHTSLEDESSNIESYIETQHNFLTFTKSIKSSNSNDILLSVQLSLANISSTKPK
jgi:hypothetical protein